MGLNSCECPDGVINTITDPDGCKILKKPKIARMVFQKVDSTNVFVNGTNGIEEAASWSGLADAVDDTKIVTTPILTEVTFAETDVIEGTENLDGAPTADGVQAQQVMGIIENINPDNAAAIDNLACTGNLGVYFVYNDNSIQSAKIADTPLTHQAIPVSPETFIGSAPSREAAIGSKFQYKFQFRLDSSWYSTSDVTSAEDGFSYKTDLLPTP